MEILRQTETEKLCCDLWTSKHLFKAACANCWMAQKACRHAGRGEVSVQHVFHHWHAAQLSWEACIIHLWTTNCLSSYKPYNFASLDCFTRVCTVRLITTFWSKLGKTGVAIGEQEISPQTMNFWTKQHHVWVASMFLVNGKRCF